MSTIKFHGVDTPLIGQSQVKVGQELIFKAQNKDGSDFTTVDIKGWKIISVFPKIDTSVCEVQTKRVAKLAEEHKRVNFISISNDGLDLINGWCAANSLENLRIVSDLKYQDFATKTKWKLSGTELLARGIIIIDKDNKIWDFDLVEDIHDLPNLGLIDKLHNYLIANLHLL